MKPDAESLKQFLPHYLSAQDKEVLLRELNAIASGVDHPDYVLNRSKDAFEDDMLQGDGWNGFQFLIHETKQIQTVKGIVISNSCDVDLRNVRSLPTRVVFAPLVKLDTYKSILLRNGVPKPAVEAKIDSIKKQHTTNVFYLPSGNYLEADYLVRLDEAQSMPLSAREIGEGKGKMFTLSNTGFYMLLFKLSIHFCRMQENVNRGNVA